MKIIVYYIIILLVTFVLLYSLCTQATIPPSINIKQPINNQILEGDVNILIIIYDYDKDGISDDIDIDVDNDNRLDLDKDGLEEDWETDDRKNPSNNITSSDRDHDNDGYDFMNDIDDDRDGYSKDVDPDDTNEQIPFIYKKIPTFPTIIGIEIKIDNSSYNQTPTVIRDNYNGTWIFSFDWNTRKFSDGEHTIIARSKVYNNYSKEESVIVIIENNRYEINNHFFLIGNILILIVISILIIVYYLRFLKK